MAPDVEEATVEEAVGPPEAEQVHGAPVTYSRGQRTVHPSRDTYLDVVKQLRDEDGFEMCVDVTAVDYLTNPKRDLPSDVAPERFEVVVNLLSLTRRERIRVRVQVPESDPTIPTLFELHPGTETMEREVFDLLGIRFDHHPDMVRILMPDDWEGHPLRKDYPVGRIPVQFRDAPGPR